MNQCQLRWMTTIGPVLFVAGVDFGRTLLARTTAIPWLADLVAFAVLAVTTFLFSGLLFRYIGRIEARMLERNRELAMTAERERIARELHDTLAQALGYTRLRATAGRDALAQGDLTKVAAAFGDIGEVTREAYIDVREAILGLRTGVGVGKTLTVALAEYLERYRLQTGLPVALHFEENVTDARLPLGAEAQLLRIIQEALANVRKHARAKGARVQLTLANGGTPRRMRVSIADDGCGFDPVCLPHTARFGLSTMRERAESVGGTFAIESGLGQGTRIVAELPLESAPALGVPLTSSLAGRVNGAVPIKNGHGGGFHAN